MKKKKAKRRAAARTAPAVAKLSPQLSILLGLGLPTVRRLARAARADRLARNARIEEISKQLDTEEDPERRAAIDRQINELIDEIPNPLVHGVYFPTDEELKDDAPVRLKKPYVSALIKSHCTPVDLERLGIRVRTHAGDIFSTFVPWELLRDLEEMPGIDYVELARPMRSALNLALPYNEITNLKGPPTNLTGAGVIVGIIDTFLCFYHPDFRNNNTQGGDHKGSTRVLFIWDQALTPGAGESGPTGIPFFTPSYGVEYSQIQIQKDLDDFRPPPGQLPNQKAYLTVRHEGTLADEETRHGTQVCGIAAGGGRAPGTTRRPGPFPGAAPQAAIIFVRNTVNNIVLADSTTVTDAFAYVFARAKMENKPCVVNMSQSDNLGPHDGTSLGEEFLDQLLLTPGRAITVAAGNTNEEDEHTRGWVTNGGFANVTLDFSSSAPLDEYAEVWYDGHDVFDVTLTVPTLPGGTMGPIAPGAAATATLPNGVIVKIEHSNDARNGDNVIALSITNVNDTTQRIPSGNWTFRLDGTNVINGAFEAWVDRNNRGARKWTSPDSATNTIAVPATGHRVIAVGGHDRAGPPPIITLSSGVGPSRDGRVKPDITAVGTFIRSPSYLFVNTTTPGDNYEASAGTSMAAPLVAGAIALLFQCRGPNLTWSDVKQLLQNTAGVPGGGVGVPSNQFGWGFLQAANICAGPTPVVDVWIQDHVSDTGVEPFTGTINWLSPDIQVLDLAGNAVSNPTHDPTSFISNIVKVTVRNRGSQVARNVEVYLYWADPATNIPFPSEWRVTGIFTGDPNFVVQSNKIVVRQLAAGTWTDVRFGWAPPAPASNIRGDDHFCLLARIEQEDDPSNVATGGWLSIGGSNNIACRNTHVQTLTASSASTAFYVTGSEDDDALEIETENLGSSIEMVFPVQALPWRDLTLINRTGRRHPYGADSGEDPLAGQNREIEPEEATLRTGIEGLTELRLADGNAHLIAPAANTVMIPEIHVKAGVKMPVRLFVRDATVGELSSFVHVRHRSGGKVIGGVTLELTRELTEAKPLVALLEGEELVIRPR